MEDLRAAFDTARGASAIRDIPKTKDTPMSVIVAKRLINMDEVLAVLEDNLPQCTLEKDDSGSTVRIQKTTHIGAKVSLSVHSLLFSQENVQKLKESGLADSVLEGLQGADAIPMPVNNFKAYLEETMSPKKAKDFLREHKEQVYGICAHNSLIAISEWDPNEFGGLLTGGNAFYISHRMTFEKELLQLLSAKIEHSAATVPSSSNCFIATAASGDACNPSVVALRRFRDQRLVQTSSGRLFIRIYEACGPMMATMIRANSLARKVTLTFCVRPCAYLVSRFADGRPEGRT